MAAAGLLQMLDKWENDVLRCQWTLRKETISGIGKGQQIRSPDFTVEDNDTHLSFHLSCQNNMDGSNSFVYLHYHQISLPVLISCSFASSFGLTMDRYPLVCCFYGSSTAQGCKSLRPICLDKDVTFTVTIHTYAVDYSLVFPTVFKVFQGGVTEERMTQMLKKVEVQNTLRPDPVDRFMQASRLQRAWRAQLAHKRLRREIAERKRANHRSKQMQPLVKFQRFWKARRARLLAKRIEYNARISPSLCQMTKYDVVYALQSLAEFISTGKVDLLQSAESCFDMAKEERYRIVAVVGLFDKGKTFLINKLLGVKLPSGKLFSTKGLSFLWVPERRMLVLDSAGVQSTVSYRSQAVQPILDAQTTESLVFEMISRIAHSMIFVVNDFTWFEQKYVAMLHQKYVQSRQSKELIVVHNLRSTEYVQEAKLLFEQQITGCYEGKVSHLGDLLFTADQGDEVPRVHHVGLCQEGSAAGEAFNTKNCAWLMHMLELRDTLGTNIKLSFRLKEELTRLLPIFVNLEAPEEVTRSRGSEGLLTQQLAIDFLGISDDDEEHVTTNAGYKTVGRLALRAPSQGQKVVMKTRGVISPLGEIIPHDVSFEPLVNVFDKATDNIAQRIIQVECPGVEEDDIELEKLPNGVKVCIEKRKAIDEAEASAHPSYPIRQHHGVWEREFMFDATEGHFEVPRNHDLYKIDKGVLTVVLDRVQNAKLKTGRRSVAVHTSTQIAQPTRSEETCVAVVAGAASVSSHSSVAAVN